MRRKNSPTQKDYDNVAVRKNIEYLDPIPDSTRIKIRWKCKFGHIWLTTYNNISRNGNCPHCAGNFPKIEEDYLSLAKKFNIQFVGPTPGSVTIKTKWKCQCGEIFNRTYHRLKSTLAKCEKCTTKSLASKNFRGFEEIGFSLFSQYRENAKSRNLEFNLTIEFLYQLYLKQNRKCALSGIDLTMGEIGSRTKITKGISNITASLDRIDSTKGYTEENVQWVHKDLNYMKMDLDQNYFIEMCKKVAENNK